MKATYNLVFSVVVIHKRSQIFYCKDPFSIFITATCIGNANEKGEERQEKRHITHFEKMGLRFFFAETIFLNAVASFEAARPRYVGRKFASLKSIANGRKAFAIGDGRVNRKKSSIFLKKKILLKLLET